MAPSAIVAAGAGASVAILAGIPLLACAALGGVAYGVVVALRLPRRPKPLKGIDPKALSQPWRRSTCTTRCRPAAASTKSCARRAAARSATGWPRSATRIDAAVQECWRVARHGDALDDGVQSLNLKEVVVPARPDPRRRDPSHPAPAESLRPHGRGAGGPAGVRASGSPRSRRTRASAWKCSMPASTKPSPVRSSSRSRPATRPSCSGLGADVDQLVDDMEALRQGLEEVGPAPTRQRGRAPRLVAMFKALRRWWKYMTAKLSGSLEERADPRSSSSRRSRRRKSSTGASPSRPPTSSRTRSRRRCGSTAPRRTSTRSPATRGRRCCSPTRR